MRKEHINKLLKEVVQKKDDDYLALTIGGVFGGLQEENEELASHLNDSRKEMQVLNNKNKRLEEMLEGNDGMSVKNIKIQFIDLHKDLLSLKRENKRYREAIEETIHATREGYYPEWIIKNLEKALERESE